MWSGCRATLVLSDTWRGGGAVKLAPLGIGLTQPATLRPTHLLDTLGGGGGGGSQSNLREGKNHPSVCTWPLIISMSAMGSNPVAEPLKGK